MKERTLIFFNDTATTEIYTRSLPRRSSDLSSRRRGARPGRGSSRGRRLLRSSRDHLPLVLLDGRVREQPPAHRVHLVRALDLHLDHAPDVDGLYATEPERRERAPHGFALRVEDAFLGPDEDADLQGFGHQVSAF